MSRKVGRSYARSRSAVALVAVALVFGCSSDLDVGEIRSYQEAGRFAETIEPLRTLLEQAPDDPELNHLYGLALLQTGQAALAIWPLRKSADDPDRAIDDGLLLAKAILASGSAEDAVAAASRVLELAPDRADVMRLKIAARLKARQNEEVLTDVERLLELNPGDPDALISRLMALLNLDRADEAEQALAEFSEAVKSLEDGYEWEPRLCGGTATFLKEKGDVESAEKVWSDCLEQFPAEEMIVFSGVEFFTELSKPERATEILRLAYEAEPTRLVFIDAYANRLRLSGQVEEGERILLAATEDGQNGIQAWFSLADYYERRGEFIRAAEAMGSALAQMGNPPPLLVAEYVDLLIRAGEYDEVDELLPSFEGEPMIANMLRGRLLLVRGQSAEALEALEEGIRLWPNNSVARWLAARAYEQMGQYDRAVTEYAEALRSEPGNRDALLSLLHLLEALGRDSEAMTVLERYWREKPTDPESLVQAIRFANRLGAQGRLDRSVARLSEIPAYRGTLVAELAAIRASRGGPAAGIEFIRDSKLDLTRPINGSALRALVAYLIADEKHGEALRAADAALAASPKEPLFHELRAAALRAAGEVDLARAAFESALALEPQRAPAMAGLGALAAASGDRAGAIALYDRASRADPDDSSYAWEAIQLVAAAGDEADVERRLEALLVRDPTDADALGLLARQLRARDPERALSLAQRAVRLRGDPDSLDLLARIQLERGVPEKAVELLRRSVELQPDQPSAHYWLGMALIATGDTEGARSELRAALESQSFAEREDAQAQLARLGGD